MKKFLIGFIIGIFFTVIIYFAPYVDPRFRVNLGRVLDKDMIYLKNGSVIQGWIIIEDGEEIYVEIKEEYFSISLSQCEQIKRNYLLQYVKELM
ncbi:MAG: hypothetical protein ISS26_05435 [Candidatus Omnitrophica bacterium]|nr:hypothetical protein [Candidatus Omnitrophota bacterium]